MCIIIRRNTNTILLSSPFLLTGSLYSLLMNKEQLFACQKTINISLYGSTIVPSNLQVAIPNESIPQHTLQTAVPHYGKAAVLVFMLANAETGLAV